jgi:large subunit ribosomal protein L6
MLRVGKKPIPVPDGVSVEVNDRDVAISGPLGELSRTVEEGISVRVEDEQVFVSRVDDSRQKRALHGLNRALIANMVHGVSSGYEKVITWDPRACVGYRAEMVGKVLELNLGYSHPIVFRPRDTVKVSVEGSRIIVRGVDKFAVGMAAAQFRGFRPPEPYKGKGLRYEGERVRRKAGKTTGGATA